MSPPSAHKSLEVEQWLGMKSLSGAKSAKRLDASQWAKNQNPLKAQPDDQDGDDVEAGVTYECFGWSEVDGVEGMGMICLHCFRHR